MMQTQSEVENGLDFSSLSSATEWKVIVSAIQTIAEDATFDVDSEGIRFRGMDPSRVALVDISWPTEAFKRFSCSRPSRFTIRVEDFSKLIKRSEAKDAVEVSREVRGSLLLRTWSSQYKREFELHLLEADLKRAPLPKLSFSSEFVMPLPSFYQVLSDVSTVSNHVNLTARNDELVIQGKGDCGKAHVVLRREDTEALQKLELRDNSTDCNAIYSLEYLLKIVKAASAFYESVKFEFSNNMPMRIEFRQATKAPTISFYLAPRIIE